MFFLLLGCTQADSNAPVETIEASLWGTVYTLAEVEQSAPPALWASNTRLLSAWVGADDAGVHQDARMWEDGQLSDTVVLPLPPRHPFAQQIFPAAQGSYHLLWLDGSTESTGENRLYSALITPDVRVERGSTVISDRLTLRYAAVPAGDGGLWVVWSGGLLAEPALYARYIDSVGRPRQPTLIERGADFPTLARANDGTIYLLWLQTQPLYTYIREAVLEDGVSVQAESFAIIDLAPSDQLLDLYAALDQTHLYIFFNVDTAPTPGVDSWMMTRPLDGTAGWSLPTGMQVDDETDTLIDTGFNTGPANAVESGDLPLTWIRPLAGYGQLDTLPAAAFLAPDQVAVAYLRGGALIGYQAVMPIQTTLLAPPALHTDRDRHLYLAWSEPMVEGYAALRMTSTKG